jgi:hypothetical protein
VFAVSSTCVTCARYKVGLALPSGALQEEESTRKQQLFNLVYSHATNHFQQRIYGSASHFFSAAYMYSEEGNKAKTARVLAVCNLGMKALDR